MKGLQTLQTYTAMNLHFSDKNDYDCFKYNFKTKVSEESLNKCRFKWQIMSIEDIFKDCDIRYLMFLIFERQNFEWVSLEQLCRHVYFFRKNIHMVDPMYRLEDSFKKDLKFLYGFYKTNDPRCLFEVDGIYTNLYREYHCGRIQLSTLILLSLHIKNVINIDSSKDIIAYPRFIAHCEKIIPFMKLFYKKVDIESYFGKYYLG